MRCFLLFLLFFNFTSALHADEPWAYCDGSNKAYLMVSKFIRDCPIPRDRPGGPARVPEPLDPELCPSRIISVSVKHPELDYICSYPTAAESGDEEARNTLRCTNGDKKHCNINAGGVAGPGDHSVPSLGWWVQTGVSKNFPYVRCQCGCFIGETMITVPSGYERIDVLAEQSKAMPVGVLQFSQSKGQSPSQPLRGPDFTVGPEKKPVIRIGTRSGAELTVTGLHPILVQRKETLTMVQAQNLQFGDVLMGEDGNLDAVLSLESFKLDLAQARVYNLDTGSVDPEEHVISANKILVGDLYWQKRLSEDSSRADNLLDSAKQ